MCIVHCQSWTKMQPCRPTISAFCVTTSPSSSTAFMNSTVTAAVYIYTVQGEHVSCPWLVASHSVTWPVISQECACECAAYSWGTFFAFKARFASYRWRVLHPHESTHGKKVRLPQNDPLQVDVRYVTIQHCCCVECPAGCTIELSSWKSPRKAFIHQTVQFSFALTTDEDSTELPEFFSCWVHT